MKSQKKNEIPTLGKSHRDEVALIVRAATSVLPGLGGLIGELFTAIASDRIDRLEEYAKRLFESLRDTKLEVEMLLEERNRNLFEVGLRVSVQQTDSGRIKYVATSVTSGIAGNVSDKYLSERIIEIVGQLSREDFRVLDICRRTDFEPRFEPLQLGNPLHEFAIAKLDRLNLIEFRPSIVRTRMQQNVGHRRPDDILTPEYTEHGQRKGRYVITRIGEMVLDSVSRRLAEEE